MKTATILFYISPLIEARIKISQTIDFVKETKEQAQNVPKSEINHSDRQIASLTRNTAVSVASLTPTSPDKRRESIYKLIMRLPAHGRQGCITNTQDDETIDKLINQIPTSKGLYKMHWFLTQKAKSLELDKNQREITRKRLALLRREQCICWSSS